jgi:hypothetical protein
VPRWNWKMLQTDVEAVRRLPGELEAIEAYWPEWSSGGLIVALAAVVYDPSKERYDSHTIESLEVAEYEAVLEQKYLGYDGNWPEVEEIVGLGNRLAEALGVPFHFTSPHHPETGCPRWWERESAIPCRDCGLLLKQPDCLSHRGTCHCCQVKRTRREARLAIAQDPLWDQELDG